MRPVSRRAKSRLDEGGLKKDTSPYLRAQNHPTGIILQVLDGNIFNGNIFMHGFDIPIILPSILNFHQRNWVSGCKTQENGENRPNPSLTIQLLNKIC